MQDMCWHLGEARGGHMFSLKKNTSCSSCMIYLFVIFQENCVEQANRTECIAD